MLFKRLFNWIKYKTLPPSVLFNNRLFVERDSKTRRVTSNLGLTFRNSKWANYARTDIPTNAKQSYITFCKTLLIVVVTTLLLTCYTKFYMTTLAYNNSLFAFWWVKDTGSYYVFTIFSIWTLFSAALMERFFSSTFLKFNSIQNSSNQIENSRTVVLTKPRFDDYKYAYFNWLTSSEVTVGSTELEELFNDSNSNQTWSLKTPLLSKTFALSSKLGRSSDRANLRSTFTDKSTTQFLDTLTLPQIESLKLGYLLKLTDNSTYSNFTPSLQFLENNNMWNLNSFTQFNSKSSELLNTSTGSFFAAGWNFSKYNSVWVNQPNSHVLYEALENQLNSLKVSKFLYHYSYLHRNILKNSHKLTMVKKLISSGFYDTGLVSNNLWSSDLFGKLSNPTNVLNSEMNLTYQNFFKDSFFNETLLNNTSINTSSNSLKLLSFYETSYFWTLKRLYNFNSLTSNTINFTLQPYSPSPISAVVESNTTSTNLTSAFKSDLITAGKFLNFNSPYQPAQQTLQSSNAFIPSSKDLFLLKTELSLISADDETVLVELTNSPSPKTPLFLFYTNTNLTPSNFLENSTFTKSSLTPSKASNQGYSFNKFFNSTLLSDLRRLAVML